MITSLKQFLPVASCQDAAGKDQQGKKEAFSIDQVPLAGEDGEKVGPGRRSHVQSHGLAGTQLVNRLVVEKIRDRGKSTGKGKSAAL